MSEAGDTKDNKNNNGDGNSLPIFSQIQYVYIYGTSDSFRNILKRDVNLKGEVEEDIDPILRNFIDFVFQLGYDPFYVSGYLMELIEELAEQRESEMEGELDDDLEELEKDDEMSDPNHGSVIKVGDKAYEDIDDIVSDDDSFNRFVEQFNKDGNLLLRKITFKAYLKYMVGERVEGE